MRTNIRILLILILSTSFFITCRETITTPNEKVEEKPIVVSLKQIQSPTEKVEWIPGNSYEIKWEITSNLDYVKIDLLKKFNKIYTIVEKTENDGSYEWLIPGSFPGSHHYRVNLTLTNNDYVASHSAEFEIKEKSNSPISE